MTVTQKCEYSIFTVVCRPETILFSASRYKMQGLLPLHILHPVFNTWKFFYVCLNDIYSVQPYLASFQVLNSSANTLTRIIIFIF